MLYYYFIKKWYYRLTTNKFSTDIVRTLSKRNRFFIGRCPKFVGHVRCPTIISHPVMVLLSNEFVFHDPEPPVTSILYGWLGIWDQFGLCSFTFSLVSPSKLIVLNIILQILLKIQIYRPNSLTNFWQNFFDYFNVAILISQF